MKQYLLSMATACMVALLVTGCASLTESPPAAAQLAVKYAALKVIEGGDDPAARAATVLAIVDDAHRFLDTTPTTVPELAREIMARVDLANLSHADRLLATALVATVTERLSERVGEGLIPGHQLLYVNTVLGWVAQAARYY